MNLARSLAAVALAALATLSPAIVTADVSPNGGTWAVALFEHTWARGDNIWCDDVPSQTSCTGANLGNFELGPESGNDNVSSYKICNNLGATRTFRITLYTDSNYNRPFEDTTLTIDDDECVVRNTVRNDEASSFRAWAL